MSRAASDQTAMYNFGTERLRSHIVPWYFLLLMLYFCASGQAHAQASNKRQICEGIVAFDEYEVPLLTDTDGNNSQWCDAYIGEDKNSPLAKLVLAQCSVGSRCIIEGLFSGRGVFYWTKIESVRRK